jgi:26S proteasome regulatory subunit N11
MLIYVYILIFMCLFVCILGRTEAEVEVMNVGKVDPRRHLESDVNDLMSSSIIQCLGTMIDTVVF